ncbi:glycosyltransferase family 2 protein [Spirosoma flavus]
MINVDPRKVFIVIPSYNEGKVIAHTLQKLRRFHNYSVVVVDDCSTDNTEAILKNFDVYYVRHSVNLGQGAALQTGMSFALTQDPAVVVHFDADGQHNHEDIPRFIEKALDGSCDIVLGSRFIRSEDLKAVPPFRRFVLKVAATVNGLMTGMWLSDAHNGFRVLTPTALRAIRLRENRMAHATEILSQIRKNKLRYVELPTHIVYTDYSKQKGQSWSNSINILLDLLISRHLR